ncbi:hypothetical protein OOZ15_09305 [Galbibacter sp. EGI 63066]|uniref:hypothetical protein n=1 Tax=Galbibacter sp. EGI 63066 TaxID=2993559 RepID=UPI00224884ED|nr:hypothetical protein [Galbibacter sp. EGI 63066]MCX2680134.1 hypothetical protein [Galbibacter sp. EGI 63066]
MKYITSTDIKHWADTLECKSTLPLLIRKLILAGVEIEHIKKIEFPYGDDVQTGGYDGDLETEKGNLFIPLGNSVWEFGVTERKREKADDDYEKRKKDTLGKVPKDTTYVSVTAKKWTKTKSWSEAKEKEGFWANVRCYDAVDLEHWLELAPTVEIWLAKHLGKPIEGVYSADDYWKDWATKGAMKFPAGLLVDSREVQLKVLQENLLSKKPVVHYIQSNTKEGSLAFILASIDKLEENIKDSIQAKTLVVENRNSFNQLIENRQPLILLPKFDEEYLDINKAITNGHTVLVPVSNSFSSDKNNLIKLPILSNETLVDCLNQMGIDKEKSRLLSKNSGRNISVLRRSLEFTSKKPSWLNNPNYIKFIPFLLIARFNSASEEDRKIIEQISGEKFSEYERFLKELEFSDESPVYNIGSNWRLISHSDTWIYLAKYLSIEDLEKFKEICIQVLTEEHPKYQLSSDKRHMASLYNAMPKYSHEIKKGVAETLIILSVLGKKYGVSAVNEPRVFVDNIVNEVLNNASPELYRSLGYNLMLLAEASPEVFLNQIQSIIDDKKVMSFFEEEGGIMGSSNDLPYLLWSLESIAWIPHLLTKVCLIICQLIELAPEKLPTLNTPFNTLKSIFKTWYPQTNASFEERKQILTILSSKYPIIGFQLLNSLIFKRNDHASPNHKMQWRLFEETSEVSLTNLEVYEMENFATNKMIELIEKNNDINQILTLISKFDSLRKNNIDLFLESLKKLDKSNQENNGKIYNAFREIIGRHRTHSKQNWAIPEKILSETQEVADLFKPEDIILSNEYLLSHHPIPMEGRNSDLGYDEQSKELNIKQKEFVEKVLTDYSIEKVIELAVNLETPGYVGYPLASIKLSEEDEHKTFQLLKSQKKEDLSFVQSFVYAIESINGQKKSLDIFKKLQKSGDYDNESLSRYLLALRFDIKLWKFIEGLKIPDIEKYYWEHFNALYISDVEEIKYSINKLKEYKRTIAVLNILGHIQGVSKLDSDMIMNTLEELSLTDYVEHSNLHLDHYGLGNVFNDLFSRGEEIDAERMAKIEFTYLFVFDSTGHGVQPKYLFTAIAKDPNLFMELIKNVYVPKNRELTEEEVEKINDQSQKTFIEYSYTLLRNFNLIPGLEPDGGIVEDELNTWIDKVRELAAECDRLEVTDQKIGEILARYPNKEKGIFFPDEICNTLERIDSNDMYIGFKIQITNRLGFTSRPSGAGGDIERSRAKHFNKLAEERKISHPTVSSVYRQIAERYIQDGQRMDEEAIQDSLR